MVKNILIIGGSRGIALAVAQYYCQCENVICVSRTKSPFGRWIEADISKTEGVLKVANSLDEDKIDVLMFLGGTWENGAFTDEYSFLKSDFAEIDRVIAVNCIAAIKIVKAIYEKLKKSDNPRALFIGSLSALENSASREVANSASKYGLRGAIQALQQELKNDRIGFTLINPGNVETPEVLQDIASGAFSPQKPIPLRDLIAVIDCAIKLSRDSYLQEANIAQINI